VGQCPRGSHKPRRRVRLPDLLFRNSNKTAEERGTVLICSADYANLGQSPTVL